MESFVNKICDSFQKMKFLLIYILIFSLFCIFYNLNDQNLNYILKRGVILEYSQNAKTTNNVEEIKQELSKKGILYSTVKEIDDFIINEYDNEGNLIEKKLLIALPFLPDEHKKELFNSISSYIFDKSPTTKLIDVEVMNDGYQDAYSAFQKFMFLTFLSFFAWLLVICVFFDRKTFFNNVKECCINHRNSIKTFCVKTKEKGAGYFLKKILFDEYDEEKEIDYTKEIFSTVAFVLVCVVLIRSFIGELRWIPTGSMIPTFLSGDRVFVEKLDFPKKEIKRGDILVFYPPGQMLDKDVRVYINNSFSNVFEKDKKFSERLLSMGDCIGGIFKIAFRYIGIPSGDMAYIKRVVGMPGEKFEIKYNNKINEYRVFINDNPLYEPYVKFNEFYLLNNPEHFLNSNRNYYKSQSSWTPCSHPRVEYCGPFTIPENSYFMMGDNRADSEDSRFWGFLEEDRIIGRANFLFFPFKRINVLKDKYLELNSQKIKNEYIKKIYIINRYELM